MKSSSITFDRIRRSTAGVNKKYGEHEYVLVSFPQLNKHSVLSRKSIDVDPLDEGNGTIKTFGSRKQLKIIGSGKN